MGIYIENNKLNFDRLECFWDLVDGKGRDITHRAKQTLHRFLETNYITNAEYDKSISLIDNMK